MTYLVIGILLGFLLALVLDDVLEEFHRGPKAKKATARSTAAHVHKKQTRKAKTRRS